VFTGIIENTVGVHAITHDASNVHIELSSPLAAELKVDQSVAHDGCCLTVVAFGSTANGQSTYTVTAIEETLKKTTIGQWQMGDLVNVERCMEANGRLDGHIVQGHVDGMGQVSRIETLDGSHVLHISHPSKEDFLTVNKGSITINGVSLTVVQSTSEGLSVAIIPYTWEHSNLCALQVGDSVNLEFDIIGKYVARMLSNRRN